MNLLKLFSRKREYSTIGLINRALKAVDSLPSGFRDEEEANRQLFTSLKSIVGDSILVQYQPRYEGSIVGDIRLGNTIIEGKLDLIHKAETDRLVGQVEYCYDYTPLDIVVLLYGGTLPDIHHRLKCLVYKDSLSIVLLEKPQRRRKYTNLL